jgi:class 3 adenylate cyclase/tetratricopeptide (TPR) repeat protein
MTATNATGFSQNPSMDLDSAPTNHSPRPLTGRRQYVTVLFSDVSGSSEHAERLEAEDYSEVLDQFRHIARSVIPRHGGTIARLQGDGVLALFGYVDPREDDGRRATDAALELHAAIATVRAGSGVGATVVQLHSGIHGGLVLLIEGDIERGRFDVVGEVPNTAFRLCTLAGSGEILVSAETLGPQAQFFRTTLLRQLPIRGRSAPLDVLRVDDRAAVERRIDAAARRGVVPFVGRDAALTELLDAANNAHDGGSPTVLVSGEAGIGKTRLIDEFQRKLDRARFRVLQGYCEGYLGAQPLQPFVQWIRAVLGWREGATFEENAAATSLALNSFDGESAVEIEPVARAFLARGGEAQAPLRASAMVDLLAAFARRQTLVLVLDDCQWADDASRHALESLRAKRLPLLLLLATRPVGEDDHILVGAHTLRLNPLDAEQADGAIAAWLPGADPFTAQEIFRQSGGSPLFIEELCHVAAAGGDLRITPRGSGVAWINSMVASRMARLPDQQAECLRVASVAGNAFPVWLLERLVDAADANPLLEALAAQDFLAAGVQPGMLRFKHVMTREAVYGTVEPARRKALHLLVAESLEASVAGVDAFELLEALSYHYDAAGKSEQAASFALAAGDKALSAMALDRARAQYITALRSLDASGTLTRAIKLQWCAIAQKLGQTCVFDPLDVAHGFVLFERALTLARETRDENAMARAEYWLAYVNYGKGRPRDAVRYCEAALVHALASDDQPLAAQVQATLGQALASAGRYEQAMPLFAQAIDSKRQQSRPGSRTAIGSAYTLGRMGYSLGDLGRFDEARSHFEEALHLLHDNVHSVTASVRELMCAVYLWQGRWEDARTAGLEGAEMALRCRSRYLTAMGRALSACGAWALNGDAASLQALREPTHWIEARGGAVSTSLNYGWLVEASVSLGLEFEARQHAARLFMRARAQDRHGEAMGCRALARWATSRGDAERAARYLDAADRAADFRGSPRERAVNRFARAGIAAATGRTEDARALVAEAGEGFESMQMHWHLQQALELAKRL